MMEQVRATCITFSFSGTQPAPDRAGGAEPAPGTAAGRGGGGCCGAEGPGARLEGAGRGREGEREGAEQLCGQPAGGGGPGPGPEEPPAGTHPQVGRLTLPASQCQLAVWREGGQSWSRAWRPPWARSTAWRSESSLDSVCVLIPSLGE